jgi:hypothetical protein
MTPAIDRATIGGYSPVGIDTVIEAKETRADDPR